MPQRPMGMTECSPFPLFHDESGIVRLAVMVYIRFPRSLCNLEDPLQERGGEMCR